MDCVTISGEGCPTTGRTTEMVWWVTRRSRRWSVQLSSSTSPPFSPPLPSGSSTTTTLTGKSVRWSPSYCKILNWNNFLMWSIYYYFFFFNWMMMSNFHCSLYHVLPSLKRGTVSARNITLLIDNCMNYYCGLLFSINWTTLNWCYDNNGGELIIIINCMKFLILALRLLIELPVFCMIAVRL